MNLTVLGSGTATTLVPLGGERLYVIRLRIANTSGAELVTDPLLYFSVEVGGGTSYTATFDPLNGCALIGGSGSANIPPGASAGGCVGFVIPSGATVTRVVAGSAGQTPGEWRI